MWIFTNTQTQTQNKLTTCIPSQTQNKHTTCIPSFPREIHVGCLQGYNSLPKNEQKIHYINPILHYVIDFK